MKRKALALLLAAALISGMGTELLSAEEPVIDSCSEEIPEPASGYEDFDPEWFRSLSEEQAEAYIEAYFSRETILAVYGDPWEGGYEEKDGASYGFLGTLFGAKASAKNITGAMPVEEACEEEVCVEDGGMPVPESIQALVSSPTVASAEGYEESAMIFNTEEYTYYPENGFHTVLTDPLSTFAADVDTGSYGNLRRYIEEGYSMEEIPAGLLRYEEILNYFDYQIGSVSDGRFSLQSAKGECPWDPEHELLQLTVSANAVDTESRGNNFVFLMDVSGSMNYDDRILLAAKSLAHLTRTLTEDDVVSVVTYSGSDDTLLAGCSGAKTNEIFAAIRQAEYNCIYWGGGTNGSGGITAAYQCAQEHFIEGGNNRVLISSDGDMNLGVTSQAGLVELIKEKKESGVFLTTLGFGEGNYSDANMEQIADAGNGNYFYIDSVEEAIRVLVRKVKQTTVTVAKDVKLQVEFNPAEVEKYKLIGYENRTMSADDFSDDTKDGGETGAGSQVTVLYEIVPKGNAAGEAGSGLKYQTDRGLSDAAADGELATLSIRYKEPDGDVSALEEYAIADPESTEEFLFTASLAEACMVINGSPEVEGIAFADVLEQMGERIPAGDIDRANCYAMLHMLSRN